MKKRNSVLRQRELRSKPEPLPKQINRQSIVGNMAARLSATFYRNLPAENRAQVSKTQLRATVADLLKAGEEVDAVIERLQEMFG